MALKTFLSRCSRALLSYTRSYSSSSQACHNNSNIAPSHLLWHNLQTKTSKEMFPKAFFGVNNGLCPSLPFLLQQQDAFLPGAPDCVTPMQLFPKRTYQPSNIRRKRNHGFLARRIHPYPNLMYQYTCFIQILWLGGVRSMSMRNNMTCLLISLIRPGVVVLSLLFLKLPPDDYCQF